MRAKEQNQFYQIVRKNNSITNYLIKLILFLCSQIYLYRIKFLLLNLSLPHKIFAPKFYSPVAIPFRLFLDKALTLDSKNLISNPQYTCKILTCGIAGAFSLSVPHPVMVQSLSFEYGTSEEGRQTASTAPLPILREE